MVTWEKGPGEYGLGEGGAWEKNDVGKSEQIRRGHKDNASPLKENGVHQMRASAGPKVCSEERSNGRGTKSEGGSVPGRRGARE